MLPARPCRPRPRPSGPRPPRGAREFRGTGNAHLMTRRRLRFGVRGVENVPCRPDQRQQPECFSSRVGSASGRAARALFQFRGYLRDLPAPSQRSSRPPKRVEHPSIILSPPRAPGLPPLRAPHSGRAMSRYRVCLDLDSRPPLLRWPTSADLWLHALAGASSLRCLGAWVEDRRAVRYGPPRRPSPRLGFVTYLLAFAGLGQLVIFIYLRLLCAQASSSS